MSDTLFFETSPWTATAISSVALKTSFSGQNSAETRKIHTLYMVKMAHKGPRFQIEVKLLAPSCTKASLFTAALEEAKQFLTLPQALDSVSQTTIVLLLA